MSADFAARRATVSADTSVLDGVAIAKASQFKNAIALVAELTILTKTNVPPESTQSDRSLSFDGQYSIDSFSFERFRGAIGPSDFDRLDLFIVA